MVHFNTVALDHARVQMDWQHPGPPPVTHHWDALLVQGVHGIDELGDGQGHAGHNACRVGWRGPGARGGRGDEVATRMHHNRLCGHSASLGLGHKADGEPTHSRDQQKQIVTKQSAESKKVDREAYDVIYEHTH